MHRGLRNREGNARLDARSRSPKLGRVVAAPGSSVGFAGARLGFNKRLNWRALLGRQLRSRREITALQSRRSQEASWFLPLLEELSGVWGWVFPSCSPSFPSCDYSICHESWDQTKAPVPKPPHLENVWALSWSLDYILYTAPAALP